MLATNQSSGATHTNKVPVDRQYGTLQTIVQIRMREGNELTPEQEEAAEAAILTHIPKPVPDGQGFLIAVYEALGEDRARELGSKYPDFSLAVQMGNWATVRQIVDRALSDNAIDTERHQQLRTMADQYDIPVA